MRILLLGTHGQVGWELQRMLIGLGDVMSLDYPELDMAQPDDIRTCVREISASNHRKCNRLYQRGSSRGRAGKGVRRKWSGPRDFGRGSQGGQCCFGPLLDRLCIQREEGRSVYGR